jgi:hypothetical protein
MSVIRPYIYSLLPDSTIKSGRFIIDTLVIVSNYVCVSSVLDVGQCVYKGLEANLRIYPTMVGVRGSIVIKELCYKSEGRGFDTR